jgi:hypothetical protein
MALDAAAGLSIVQQASSGAEALLEDIAQLALFGAAQVFAPQAFILSDDVKWCARASN